MKKALMIALAISGLLIVAGLMFFGVRLIDVVKAMHGG